MASDARRFHRSEHNLGNCQPVDSYKHIECYGAHDLSGTRKRPGRCLILVSKFYTLESRKQ
eukprot:11764170-Heterocapsa_arctica.AAC.1